MLQKWVNNITGNLDFKTLETTYAPNLKELGNFHFSASNPLLWMIYLIAFIIFSRFLGFKKSFYFCLIVFVILLATSELENLITTPDFDFTITKLISAMIIMFVSIYFFFIKND